MVRAGRVQVHLATKMLVSQLPNFEIGSDEFDATHKAIETLSKVFGKSEETDKELYPAEILSMLAQGGMAPQQHGASGAPPQGAPMPPPPAQPPAHPM